MKDYRSSIQNHPSMCNGKSTGGAVKSNISSLKAIMNQGRVPLSQYMNEKTVKSNPINENRTYFDKLKAMFNKGELTNRQKQLNNKEAMDIQKMEDEAKPNNVNDYLYNFEETNKNISFNKNKLETYNLHTKERSKSMNTKSRPKVLPSPKLESKQINRKITEVESNTSNKKGLYTLTDLIVPDQKIQNVVVIPRFKPIKKEIINYSKFESVFQSEQTKVQFLQLDETLGCGANAIVRLGRDKRSQALFAIKIYEKYKLVEPSKKKRVLREIQILSRLDHPNIIKICSCFQDKRQIHILFQFIPQAETLQDYIRSNSYQIHHHVKWEIATKITEALCYMHSRGVSHRDIKTDNIIIGQDGLVKLIDFGFATTVQKGETHCGTPNYMAPELFCKKSIYQPFKVDVWALGILLFYLFQGAYPFKGYNQKDLARNITLGNICYKKSDNKIRSIINLMLNSDPQQRPNMEKLLQIITN